MSTDDPGGQAGEVKVVVVVPLDLPLMVDPGLVGVSRDIVLPSTSARLCLPAALPPAFLGEPRSIVAPSAVSKQIEDLLPDGSWGREYTSGAAGVLSELDAVTIVVSANATLEQGYDLARHPPGGDAVLRLKQESVRWIQDLIYWAWVVTAQSVDLLTPGLGSISRNTELAFFWIEASEVSSPMSSSGGLMDIVMTGEDNAASERLVNDTAMAAMIAGADSGARAMPQMELLARARIDARRGENRRAIMDAGTAAEGALTALLGLPTSHKQTLGNLVTAATHAGLAIPTDAKPSLVNPRNDAVHRGANPAGIHRAIEIVEEIVRLAEPSIIPASQLTGFWRPYNQDLRIIQPPTWEPTATEETS